MAASTTENPREARAATDPGLTDLLRRWAPSQRWYPAKGDRADLQSFGVVQLSDPAGTERVEVHLFELGTGAVLQVPVVLRPVSPDAPGTPPTPGLIGHVTSSAGTVTAVVDGPHDPAFLRAWLAAAQRPTGQRPSGTSARLASSDPTPGRPDASAGARVLTGEQSNTSVLLPGTSPPGILKVFRGVSTGPSPDVEVPLALSARWGGVPRPLAWLVGGWYSGGAHRTGHLGVLSELVPDARDGFELACAMAAAGTSIGSLAEALGRTTAQMHRALRDVLPVADRQRDTLTPQERDQVVATLRTRAAAAVRDAPVLVDRASRVDEVLGGLADLAPLPTLQRVHGDYHLGQVLHSAQGWSVLDFEGEPQASQHERTRPDLALRDLAGMLRSFDYAAAVGGAADTSWADEARTRLTEGYLAEDTGTGSRPELTRQVLRALELDKALYEVVYETRNRPEWVRIPLDGVDRLLVGDRWDEEP